MKKRALSLVLIAILASLTLLAGCTSAPASTSAFTGVLFCAMFSASFDVFRFCLDYSIFPGRFLSVFVTKNVL